METLVIVVVTFVLVLAYYLLKSVWKKSPLQIWMKKNNLLNEINLTSKVNELFRAVNESYNRYPIGGKSHKEFNDVLNLLKPHYEKLVIDIQKNISEINSQTTLSISLGSFGEEVKKIMLQFNGNQDQLVSTMIVPLELVHVLEAETKKLGKIEVSSAIKTFLNQIKIELGQLWKF